MTSSPRAHGWGRLYLAALLMIAIGAFAVWLSLRPDASPDGGASADCSGVRAVRTVGLVAAVPATPAQLSASADVLRDRLRLYDCGHDTSVAVQGSRLQVSAGEGALRHLDELITPGHLQFREVMESRAGGQCLPVSGVVPALADVTACSTDGLEQFRLAAAKVQETDVEKATVRKDRTSGDWQIVLRFTDRGQAAFTELTSQLVGKRMAIVLDGAVLSAPSIMERIQGDAQINGSFTEESAKGLVNTLTSGPLPVPLRRG